MLAADDPSSPTSPHRSAAATDHAAIRERYFAAVVGRSPAPPREAFPEVTPRKGGVVGKRAIATGDANQDILNANAAYKSHVLQEASTILSTAESLTSFISNKCEKFPELAKRMDDACRGFDDGFKWVLPAGYTLQTVQKDGVLTLTPQLLEAILCLPRHLSPLELQQALDDLSGTTKLARVTLHDVGSQLTSLDPHLASSKAEPASPISPSPSTSSAVALKTSSSDVSQVLLGLYDSLHLDVQNHALDELRKTDADRNRLLAQLQQAKRDLDACLDEGRLVEAEEAHKEVLNAYIRYIEILAQRAQLIQMTNTDAGLYAEQVDAAYKEADTVKTAYRKDKVSVLYDVEKDLEKIKDVQHKQDLKEDTATKRYETSESSFQLNLKENEKEQQKLLEEMRKIAKRIEVLSDDREVMAKSHISAREERDRDLFQVGEYRGACDRYTHMLEQLQDYLKKELAVADQVDGYVDKMKQRQADRPADDDLGPLREAELEDLYRHYREYVYCSGDLATKKQHRTDVLERQVRFALHNRESVKECLDPNATKYESDVADLTLKLRLCETVIASINEQEDVTEQLVRQPLADFEAIVENKRCEEFVHPTVEYAEKAVEDRRAFVDKTLRFVEGEERAVEKKKLELDAKKAHADQEHQHHLLLSAQKKSSALAGGGGSP